MKQAAQKFQEESLYFPVGPEWLEGDLFCPENSRGLIIFVLSTDSPKDSTRNRAVAKNLNGRGFATFLCDLLSKEELAVDSLTLRYRFNIHFLCDRIVLATEWLREYKVTCDYPFGFFAVGVGAAIALRAATERCNLIRAIVCRSGCPDFAGPETLGLVRTPTLFIVGDRDREAVESNTRAAEYLRTQEKRIEAIQGMTAWEQKVPDSIAQLASDWYLKYLT